MFDELFDRVEARLPHTRGTKCHGERIKQKTKKSLNSVKRRIEIPFFIFYRYDY